MAVPFGPSVAIPLLTNSTTSGSLTLVSTRMDAFVKTDSGVWVVGANVEVIPAIGAAYVHTFQASATDVVNAVINLVNFIGSWI